MTTQVSASQFAETDTGHKFVLRSPLAKVTARRCAECGQDVFKHAYGEVEEHDLLQLLCAVAENRASTVIESELLVGGFKSVATECQHSPDVVVLNCAGRKLHALLPLTRPPFDRLRETGRLLDVEWEDREDFMITADSLGAALRWACGQVRQGRKILCNCAQGKSRSGAMATAYLMATRNLGFFEALNLVQAGRPLVQPNTGFTRQLQELEGFLRGLNDELACRTEL